MWEQGKAEQAVRRGLNLAEGRGERGESMFENPHDGCKRTKSEREWVEEAENNNWPCRHARAHRRVKSVIASTQAYSRTASARLHGSSFMTHDFNCAEAGNGMGNSPIRQLV